MSHKKNARLKWVKGPYSNVIKVIPGVEGADKMMILYDLGTHSRIPIVLENDL